MGKSSLIVIAIVMAFLTGFGSGIRVQLQAPDKWVINVSSIESSSDSTSFFFYEFPDSRVVIYTPMKPELAMCSAPLAAINDTSKTFISLKKPAGCNVNVVVRVDVLDQWSEVLGTVKKGLIVWNIQANRANFRMIDPTQKKNGIGLRLTKPEDGCITDLSTDF